MPEPVKKLHQSAVAALFLQRDDLGGTPYMKLTLRQHRTDASAHLNAATLMSVAAGLIEASKELQFGRGVNADANNDADVRTPDAEAL